jgi:DNA polymerase III delta' subunit
VRLADVRHQERAVAIIRQALRSGRLSHAYLFEGPEGVGKELAARALAARLLCQTPDLLPDADACGGCRSCQLLARDNHPDFHLIHRGLHRFHPDRAVRARKGLFLGVELIRYFLIEPATRKPAIGPYRVFVLREAERMNEEAQNALLKTLEEPPGPACLVLVTASADRLLPTIRSRCQSVPFGPLPTDFVRAELVRQQQIPPEDAQALASLSAGRLGLALRWHKAGVLGLLEEVGASLDELLSGRSAAFASHLIEHATRLAAALADSQAADEDRAADADSSQDATGPGAAAPPPGDELREAVKLVLLAVAAVCRDALIARCGADALHHLPAQRERTRRLARALSAEQLEHGIRAAFAAERMLDQNVAPQLVCDFLAAVLFDPSRTL